MALFYSFLFLILTVSSATACDSCIHQTKVAYFSKASALESGACGYGSLATGLNSAHLAAAIPTIYKDGAGCGACFQIRCKDPKVCTKEGTTVMVTDLNKNNETDFVLSSLAFTAMAHNNKGSDLQNLAIVDVEYKRVPCDLKQKNLAVRIEESSQKPHYLALKFLYQGGQTEILAVDVAQVGSIIWYYMSRNHGAVWDTSKVPSGALQIRFVVTAGFDGKYYWAKSVLPSDWKIGKIYDTGLQISDIAIEAINYVRAWRKEMDGGLIISAKSTLVRWVKPVFGIKLNVDGSLKYGAPKAGIGGVFRDTEGNYIGGFASAFETDYTLHAELFALHCGLSLAIKRVEDIIVTETDSLELHALVKGGGSAGDRLDELLLDCLKILALHPNYEFMHRYREANMCADFMAKMGARMEGDAVYYGDPPENLKKLIMRDK